MTPPTPSSTLFPYTTLFRSQAWSQACPEHTSGRGPRVRPGIADARHRACVLQGRGRENLRGGIHGERARALRSEEHTSELQSRFDLVCRLLLEKKNQAKPCT